MTEPSKADELMRIATAALLEVGEPTWPLFLKPDLDGTMSLSVHAPQEHPMAMKAARLARMALEGPDWLSRCDVCARNGIARGTKRCIPVRDAIRGMTCS